MADRRERENNVGSTQPSPQAFPSLVSNRDVTESSQVGFEVAL